MSEINTNYILKVYYQSENLLPKVVCIPSYSLSESEMKILLENAKTLTVSLESISGITHRHGMSNSKYSQMFSKIPNVVKLSFSSVNGVLHCTTDSHLSRILSKIIENNPPEDVFTDNIISEYMKNIPKGGDKNIIPILILRTRDAKIKIPNKKCVELYYS